jgi:hypothetical protein
MKTLSQTWFADGYIDFELKKYTLLAYLQEINRYFCQNKLYPQLADIIFHYNNLVERKNRKDIQIREQQFFDHLLKGEKPSKWITEGVPATMKGKDMGLGY